MSTVTKRGCNPEEDIELRRGPWTLEEDTLLIHYIACHGEGRWNLVARCSGKTQPALFTGGSISSDGWIL